MRRFFIALAPILLVMAAPSTKALCIYKGQMYAKTTLTEEFADAKWVVQAKVLAADNHWSDEDEPWTIYHVQVLTTFKGKPLTRLQVFTYRDSGGFYLDKRMNPDLGGVYLLFLDPISPDETVPDQARNATEVNYACGQSRAWNAVSIANRRRLATLSQANR